MKCISIIIRAYNAEKTIAECLTSVQNLDWDGELEAIVVNDGSSDRTAAIAAGFSRVQIISVPNGGAPRAMNIGIQATHCDIVASVDADMVLEREWLKNIIPWFEDPSVAAVTGYVQGGSRKLIGRITGYHNELRQDSFALYVDAVGNGNTAYRRQAIMRVGMFDEQLKVGEDTDMSQRLISAGYRLIFNREARCQHYWRDNLKSFLKQQYDYAYSHLDFVKRYGRTHNQVSTLRMVLQVPFTGIIVVGAIVGGMVVSSWSLMALLLLPLMHLPDTIRIFGKKKELAILALPWLFTLRNLAWIYASIVWGLRSTRKMKKARDGK